MQETTKKNVMKEPKADILEQKETINYDNIHNKQDLDSGTALQLFLDHIPISSIPGVKNSPELQLFELNAGDSIKNVVHLLYEKNVAGAPIADILASNTTTGRFSDRYIGFIDFASIILWSLEQCGKNHIKTTGNDDNGNERDKICFFTMLELNPQVGQTKIGELAKSFLWDPFFPVHLDDTLFHVLLLLSKHPLRVVPVTEIPNSKVIGFITQNAVVQLLLLRSNGLYWFDGIADKPLSEFRFESEDHFVRVYGDQSIAEALQIFCQNRVDAMAVLNRETKRLVGTIRRSDIYLLLENDNLLLNRETLTAEEFIHVD